MNAVGIDVSKGKSMTHRAERSAELTEAILESNLAERKNRERLFLDESTGLPNDLLFHDRLREEILAARHFANGFCVVYLNLYYPDIQESETKDLRLEISNRLVKIMRKTDIISWAGKFELLILLNDINETVFMAEQSLVVAIGSDIHGKSDGYKKFGKAVRLLGEVAGPLMERSQTLLCGAGADAEIDTEDGIKSRERV